ncbi:MAG: hypothetical protein LBV26_07105 [Bacteroidales bacterium]|jgi:hypothetical protein|nr:hypothetical protein [Bacteroidales bacterium]
MTDGRANIDLVFRNGLKDYEVLPPVEVWENIKPAIGRKKKHVFFLRTAAAVAIFVSVSILAYMWGYETSRERFFAGAEPAGSELVAPLDIVIPAAIMPDKAEPVMAAAATAGIGGKQAETATVPQYRAEVSDITPANQAGVNIKKALAGAIEPLPEIQQPFKIKYFKVFSPAELQPVIYSDNYESAAEAEETRWSVLAMVSPTHYSQFTTSGNDLSRQIMASDQGRASYSGGMGFAYKINKRLSVQSGVYYSAMGQELGEVSVYGGFQQANPSKSTDNFKVLTPNGTVLANNPDIYLGSGNIPERVLSRYTIDEVDPVKANLNYLGNSLLQDMKYIELPLFLRYMVFDKKVGSVL